jgi:hypothetical protein
MKVSLTFSYDDESETASEDKKHLEDVLKVHKYMRALSDFDVALREKIKYTDEKGSFEEARALFSEVMKEGGIDPHQI